MMSCFAVAAPAKGVNVDGVGTVNGVNIYEYDLDTGSEDKPWRKPGKTVFHSIVLSRVSTLGMRS